MSPAPHFALGAYEQYCFSGQRKPAMPPHSLPSEEVCPTGGGVAALAEGSGDAESAGVELTTPLGVSTGGARVPGAGTLLALVAGTPAAVVVGA
jgi:hypothetical protein